MRCNFKGCAESSLLLSEFCWDHLPDKEDYKARLLNAAGSGADLSKSNLKKVVLHKARIDKVNFSGSDLSQSDLSGTVFFDTNLDGADLIGADLSGVDLTHCSLDGADLTKANLEDARLWGTSLDNSNLTECNLSRADLWNASLFNAKIWHAVLRDAKSLTKRNFSGKCALIGKSMISEAGFLSAEESYRDLKQYFISNGRYGDASWASFKEKTLERFILKERRDLAYIPSLVMSILCGYGEKPQRIVLSAFLTIMLFALLYGLLGAVEASSGQAVTLRWSDYIYYSTVTFTTVGYGDFVPKASAVFRFLAAFEAFLGVFLSGLFIFTLARKYSAR